MLQAIAMAVLCRMADANIYLGRRRGDSSSTNVFSYDVVFTGQKGTLISSASMTLQESLTFNGSAVFSISNIQVKRGTGPFRAWNGTPPESWSDQPLSAQSLFLLPKKFCRPGERLAVQPNLWFALLSEALVTSTVVSGTVEYVKESHSMAGLLRIRALDKETVYKVYAGFDPRTGRPLEVKIGDSCAVGGLASDTRIALTIRASGMK